MLTSAIAELNGDQQLEKNGIITQKAYELAIRRCFDSHWRVHGHFTNDSQQSIFASKLHEIKIKFI